MLKTLIIIFLVFFVSSYKQTQPIIDTSGETLIVPVLKNMSFAMEGIPDSKVHGAHMWSPWKLLSGYIFHCNDVHFQINLSSKDNTDMKYIYMIYVVRFEILHRER